MCDADLYDSFGDLRIENKAIGFKYEPGPKWGIEVEVWWNNLVFTFDNKFY